MRLADHFRQAGKITLRRRRRHGKDHPASDNEAECMDGIGRIGGENDIARTGNRLGEVGETFLGADSGDDFRFRRELHIEAPFIVTRHGAPQADNPAGGGITVRLRIVRRLAKLVDDMRRRRHVGIAHAEVNDVALFRAQLRLEFVHFLKDVRRQFLDAVEFFFRHDGRLDCS